MKRVTTVGTLIEYQDKILILLRGGKEENAPGTWGLAAGRHKTEGSEQESENSSEAGIRETAIREIEEETGLKVKESELIPAGVFEWPQTAMHVTFHAFRLAISEPFEVLLDPDEHIDYKWATKEEILALDKAIAGLKDLVQSVYDA